MATKRKTKGIYHMTDFVVEARTLGGRLQNAREKQKLSISLVAKLSGVQSKTLKNWELDRSEPRSNRLVNLAGVLGVTASYLLDGTGGEIEPEQKSKTDIKMAIGELEIEAESLTNEIVKSSERLKAITRRLSMLRQSEW